MKVFVNENETWLRWIAPNEFSDEELFRIVIFFVFHSPCPTLSAMGRMLDEYNWHTPWRKPYYLNKHLKQISTNSNLLYTAKSYETMSDALKSGNLYDNFPNDLGTERICVYDNMHNQFLSVFFHIRNAFAHCRLNMVDVNGECVFVLEDIVRDKKKNTLKVSARMIIKKSTLIKWIDLIEAGEKKYVERV